jgi:predicted Ser/Thr protein kinase
MASPEGELTAIVSRPLGRYRLLSRLGEGGMGVVHLALDPSGTPVAVKVLRPHVAGDEMGRARLAREVATLRRVRGPRVGEVLDADVEAAQPYIVTRYVPGPSLEKVVRERGPMRLHVLLRLAEGLADALCTLGAAGVVHRDLKPGNVLLADDGPVLIDFGIARVADDSTLTGSGLLVGTPGYLPPEVVAGERATAASDIYSLAATLAYAGTGRPPFGQGPFDVVLANISRGAVDLTGIDPSFADLLRRMLSAEPAARPIATEVRDRAAAALARANAAANGAAPADAASTVVPPRPARSGARVRGVPDTKVLTAVAPAPAAPLPAPGQQPPDERWKTVRNPMITAEGGEGEAAEAGQPPPEIRPSGVARTGRPALTAAAYAAIVALSAVLPLAAFGLLVLMLIMFRTVNATWRATTLRRLGRGKHWTDGLITTVMLPGRAVVAALVTGLTVLLASFAAAGAFVFGWQATGLPNGPVPPAAAAAVAALQLWWGPGGSAVRQGWRLTTAKLMPSGRAAAVGMLLLLGAAALAMAGALSVPEADWWPMTTQPGDAVRAAAGGSLGDLGFVSSLLQSLVNA